MWEKFERLQAIHETGMMVIVRTDTAEEAVKVAVVGNDRGQGHGVFHDRLRRVGTGCCHGRLCRRRPAARSPGRRGPCRRCGCCGHLTWAPML